MVLLSAGTYNNAMMPYMHLAPSLLYNVLMAYAFCNSSKQENAESQKAKSTENNVSQALVESLRAVYRTGIWQMQCKHYGQLI